MLSFFSRIAKKALIESRLRHEFQDEFFLEAWGHHGAEGTHEERLGAIESRYLELGVPKQTIARIRKESEHHYFPRYN